MSPYSEDDPLKQAINTLNCLGRGVVGVLKWNREEPDQYVVLWQEGGSSFQTKYLSSVELIAYAAKLYRLRAFL